MTEAKFKIDGTEYVFKPITLKAYYKLQEILKRDKKKKQEEFEIVESITDCPVKELKRLSYQDWLTIWEEAIFRLGSISGGNTDVIKPTFKLSGISYSLPDVDKMSIGEFADLEVLLASPNSSARLNEVAAILYRPILKKVGKKVITEEYTQEGFEIRRELFMDMPIEGIRSANAFFLQFAQQSLKSTAESLLQTSQMKSLPPEIKERYTEILTQLQESGGELSTLLLDQTLLNLTNLPSSQSAQHLTGFRGRKMNIVSRFMKLKNKLLK